MIILLYGQDSYRSREKINQIIEKYKQTDKTQSGLFVFDGDDFTVDKLRQSVTEQSFFTAKKLIIIKNIFSDKKRESEIAEYFKIHQELYESKDIVIVLWQGDGIKSSNALFKVLTKKGISVRKQEFKTMSENDLKRWVQGKLGHVKISQSALQNLILYAGNDLWCLDNEIKKLAHYKPEGTLTVEDIDVMISGNAESNIFQAIDALGQKNFFKAMQDFNLLSYKGEEAVYLFSMIAYQFRNLLKVKDASSRGGGSVDSIVKRIKIHPFVARKTLSQVRNYTLEELKDIYADLQQFDLKIKTGKLEPELALDLFLISKLSS